MTKRRTASARTKAKRPELPEVLTEERTTITNFEKVRLEQRGLDTFTIYYKDGKEVEVEGHEIAVATKASSSVDLPVYQIVEYIEVDAAVRYVRAYNQGEVYDESSQVVRVSHEEEDTYYLQVIKAVLWPGEWKGVTRTLGTDA